LDLEFRRERILFISDAHLDPREPERTVRLARFLESQMARTDRLVILGDLFDFWFGYRHCSFHYHFGLLVVLRELTRRGIAIEYFLGNHDFDLGPLFEEVIPVRIHPGPVRVRIDGYRVYLAHGDRINVRDYGYRFFSRLVRNRLAQAAFRQLHPDWGWRLATRSSKASRRYVSHRIQLDPLIYERFLRGLAVRGYDVVLHGHFHEPRLELYELGERRILVGNPGDWMESFTYIRYEAGRFRLLAEEG
jgi:UDP-2,3-diacylglucosamine hydrolase